jgi:hypothetical protein
MSSTVLVLTRRWNRLSVPVSTEQDIRNDLSRACRADLSFD